MVVVCGGVWLPKILKYRTGGGVAGGVVVGGGVCVDWTLLTIFNPEQSSKLLRVVPLGTWVPRYLSSPQVSVGHPPVLLGMSILVPVGLGLVLDGDVVSRLGGVGGGGSGGGPVPGGGGDGGVGPGPGGGDVLGPGGGGGGPDVGGPVCSDGTGTSGSSTSCSTPSSALLCAALRACRNCDLCFLSAQWLYFISQFPPPPRHIAPHYPGLIPPLI